MFKTNTQHRFFDLGNRFYSEVQPTPLQNCRVIHKNAAVAQLLGLEVDTLSDEQWLQLAGQLPCAPFKPLAMKYAGHQFGSYNPELGDGRGLLLGEFVHKGRHWDLHIKGSGQTPYSRFGDGRAVLRSSIREYLAGEALHGLGIATTRALALFISDEPVMRETQERGALLLRVAKTHIRFGSFEHFYYSRQPEQLQILADHVIAKHYPEDIDNPKRYIQLLNHTISRTAKTIAQWQAVGFTHGVMNTDNMSILGDTFDYGPYGFMDDYQPNFVCNHSDDRGRYAFDQQPSIGLWNLNALAQAFSTLIDIDDLKEALSNYQPELSRYYAELMNQKLGLTEELPEDQQLLADWLRLLELNSADYTLSFRALCKFDQTATERPLRDTFKNPAAFDIWSEQYCQRLNKESRSQSERQNAMQSVNPKYILRNSLAQSAIEKAETGDYSVLNDLFEILQNPFAEQPEFEHYAKAPDTSEKGLALSCSS